MKPKVYLETTIPSYLTAWSSRDLIKAAHQQITREWWQDRVRFDLYISQLVLREASGGDIEAVRLRLESLIHTADNFASLFPFAIVLHTGGPVPVACAVRTTARTPLRAHGARYLEEESAPEMMQNHPLFV